MNNRAVANRKVAIIAAGIVGLAVVCFVALIAFLSKPKTPIDGRQVVQALQRFKAAHRPLPESVTFSQLIAEGYLGSNVLRDFGAVEVTIYTKADESRPQMFLMDALMPDGSHIAALADGSVAGFSPSRFNEALKAAAASTSLPATTNGEAVRPGGPR